MSNIKDYLIDICGEINENSNEGKAYIQAFHEVMKSGDSLTKNCIRLTINHVIENTGVEEWDLMWFPYIGDFNKWRMIFHHGFFRLKDYISLKEEVLRELDSILLKYKESKDSYKDFYVLKDSVCNEAKIRMEISLFL